MNQFVRHRKKIFVQKPIQGGLVLRTVMYWFFCLCTIFLFLAIGTVLTGNLSTSGELFAKIWRQLSPAVIASLFLLPLVILDVIRFSHRIVGPLLRLESEMKRLADGQQVATLRFRKHDHWQGLAEQFNRIEARIRDLKDQAGNPDSESTDSEAEGLAQLICRR